MLYVMLTDVRILQEHDTIAPGGMARFQCSTMLALNLNLQYTWTNIL